MDKKNTMSSTLYIKSKNEKESKARFRCLLMPCFYFAEFPLFVMASVATYTLHFTSTFQPRSVSYSTSDLTLALPYTPEKDRVISPMSIYAGSILGPITIIIIVEAVLFGTTLFNHESDKHSIKSAGCIFPLALRRVVRYIGLFVFGLMCATIICNIVQLNNPVLAPYLLNFCDGTNNTGDTLYSTDCVSVYDDVNVEKILKQFPSYFCTLSAYASSFALIYVRNAMSDAGPAVKTLVTWSPLSFSYILGILEISENVSHSHSVLAGWVLGIAVAVYVNIELYSSDEGRLSVVCQRKVVSKEENLFDTGLGAGFMVEEEAGVGADDYSPKNTRVVEECTSFHSPAFSRISHASEPKEALSQSTASPSHSVGITNVERNVIKELQTYIAETDFKSPDCGSPKPADIRQFAKTGKPKEEPRLSTFANPISSDSSSNNSDPSPKKQKDIAGNYLHSSGSDPVNYENHPDKYLYCTYPRKITSIKEEVEVNPDIESEPFKEEDLDGDDSKAENSGNLSAAYSSESDLSGIAYDYSTSSPHSDRNSISDGLQI